MILSVCIKTYSISFMKINRRNNPAELKRQRRAASQRLATCGRMIKGSLVVNRRRCGKPECHCAKEQLHQSLAFTYKKNGKSVLIHIPHHLTAEARQAQQAYQKLKTLTEHLSQVNLKLLKYKAQRYRLHRRRIKPSR